MNGFEKHGIDHSSPSSLNMWADAPCAWAAKYIYGYKFSFGVAPLIGTLVERVVAETLCGGSYENALSFACDEFKRKTAIAASEKDRARIDDIDAMANLAVRELKQYGEPEFIHTISGREQQRVELICNGLGWKIPVIGYLDFVYPKHGLIIDLKTTLRCPSEISVPHARQAAIYSRAKGNMSCKILYVTPKKTAIFGVDDVGTVLSDVKTILNRQEAFLRALDKDQIKHVIPVNASSFYWSQDSGIRKELYGV